MKRPITLLTLLSLLTLSGCVDNKTSTNESGYGLLEVNFTIAGYGQDYVEELCNAFTEKTGIEVKYTMDDNATNSAIGRITTIKKNTCDLFFTMVNGFDLVDQCRNKSGYDNLLMDFGELYEREVPGTNGIKLKDLVRPDLKEANKTFNIDGSEGKYYMIPWTASVEGLIVNKDVLAKYEITQLPRTTNEWEEILDIIKAGKTANGGVVVPKDRVAGAITCANNSAYWEFVWPTWWAQYEGIENYENYYACKPQGAQERYVPTTDALDQEGKLLSMKELDRFLNKTNGYMDPSCVNRDHLQTQVDFLDGKSAFIPSGAWIESETAVDFYKEGKNVNFEYMKTPVTSYLGTKLGIEDEELREAIDYCDGITTTKPTFNGKTEAQSETILNEIGKARGIVASGLTSQNKIMMPSYTKQKEEAYQFVLFYASPEGQEILMKHGIPSAFNHSLESYDAFSKFNQSVFNVLDRSDTTLLINGFRYPLVYKAGLTATAHRVLTSAQKGFETVMYEGKKTPQTLYNEELDYYKAKWSQFLLNAGYGA